VDARLTNLLPQPVLVYENAAHGLPYTHRIACWRISSSCGTVTGIMIIRCRIPIALKVEIEIAAGALWVNSFKRTRNWW